MLFTNFDSSNTPVLESNVMVSSLMLSMLQRSTGTYHVSRGSWSHLRGTIAAAAAAACMVALAVNGDDR